ncbi:MAG: hypothetical protein NDJ89_01075 [Oligoflexia bacterium]|nr:hypothetical protein [Oligoflexia bacterium]
MCFNFRRFPFSILLLLLGSGPAISARADIFSRSATDEAMAYCTFGPKVRIVATADKPEDRTGCAGSAKIQAVQWECASFDGISARVERFRKKLVSLAEAECGRFCASRAKGCQGRFQAPTRCGLQTDYDEGIAAGKKLGCRSDCAGTALSFCSLYDAGYRTDDPALISKQAPNCLCAR